MLAQYSRLLAHNYSIDKHKFYACKSHKLYLTLPTNLFIPLDTEPIKEILDSDKECSFCEVIEDMSDIL